MNARKTFRWLLTTVFTFNFGIATWANDSFKALAEEIPAPVDDVFIPQGFDSNDTSPELVIAGTFPDSCHKMGKMTYKVNEEAKRIEVDITAYRIKSDFCLAISVPYVRVVALEHALPAGTFSVAVNKFSRGSMPIQFREPGATRDDHLYAPVYGLIQNAPREFTIQGVSPNHCYEISEVQTKPDGKNVLAVFPIMKKTDGCDEASDTKAVAWIKQFSAPTTMSGRTLIHVRSLDGGSINQVVTLPQNK